MLEFSLSLDLKAFFLFLGFTGLLIWLLHWRRRQLEPSVYFSSIKNFKEQFNGKKTHFISLPQSCIYGALFSFLLAFSDISLLIPPPAEKIPAPENASEGVTPSFEGIAIYLLLDVSGSMAEKVSSPSPEEGWVSKIDLLKYVTEQFIKGSSEHQLSGRQDDLIGIVTFARAARVIAPLTLDHEYLLKELQKVHVVKDQNDDGTAIGYAIFKTAHLIQATKHFAEDFIKQGKPAYEIKSSVMLLVTDGFQNPNPLDQDKRLRNIDLDEAAEYAKQQGIKLYIANVDPMIKEEEYTPQRKRMQRICELTGGKFYVVDEKSSLASIYADIDHLEKGKFHIGNPPSQNKLLKAEKSLKDYQHFSLYPFLIGAGMILVFCSIVLETVFLKRIP